MRFQDLTGQKFGLLTVKYRIDDYIKPDGRRVSKWHCDCDCGGIKDITSDNLKYSKTPPSCGCLSHRNRVEKNRESFLWQKFGRLIIIEEDFSVRPTKAKCLCDCGNYITVTRADVVMGHTQSCGCLQRERASEYNVKDWTGAVSEYGVKFVRQEHTNDKGQWLWRCECGLCGNEFVALPAKINNGHITSCGCAIQSAGERYVLSILDKMEVEHSKQHTFPDCKYKNILRYDFAVFDNNKLLYLIEYNGKQHYEPIEFFGGQLGFEETQARDNIKKEYCQSHNIPLLVLPYTLSNDEIKQQIYEYHSSLTTAGYAQ
jgi:hypothetical protein